MTEPGVVLRPGERVRIAVYAHPWLDRSGVQLEAGGRYHLEARGHWWDFFIPSGPAGYRLPFFKGWEPRRRQPHQRWFALVATVDGNHDVVVGNGIEWTPPASGELLCYANDMPGRYWNDHGSVLLWVTRLS